MTQLKALIIDDNADNVRVLEQLLGLENVDSVQLATSSNLYKDLSELSEIAVVFLDLEMPHINGFDALRIIKSHPNFIDVPVIAYSVHVSEVNVTVEHGFDGFLGKPLDSDLFPEQLTRILNGEKVHYIP